MVVADQYAIDNCVQEKENHLHMIFPVQKQILLHKITQGGAQNKFVARLNHRYTTLNRDRKRRHAPCILPVQLMSLVGNEAGFAQNRFERPENCSNSFNTVCYCVVL